MKEIVQDRTRSPEVVKTIHTLLVSFDKQRMDLLDKRANRRAQLTSGDVDFLPETASIRKKKWTVDALPEELNERRVELIGGASRSEVVTGLNSGAKTYIADLWNFTPGDPWNMMRAHRNLERAAQSDLAFQPSSGGRIRINPGTTTRLMITPRPMYAMERGFLDNGEPVPATFFDLALLAHKCAAPLVERQGGLYLYLRDIQGHHEARWWAAQFKALENALALPQGSIRATVMIDTIAGALEAEEILFELSHYAAGMSFDPQGYASDHIALYHSVGSPVLPDRESIGLNAHFLRSLSLHTIGICHRRGCHAIGAPSFVLPPADPDRAKAEYLEMLVDKEREALDGHDGTIVVHVDTVNAAMMEFNKSMPRAHQLYYERNDGISAADLIQYPTGEITVPSLLGCVRTALRTMVQRGEGLGWVVQGGRMHDRSSLRLALRLLWHWAHSKHGVITETGLDVNSDLLIFLIKKESTKMFGQAEPRTHAVAAKAVAHLLELVNGVDLPLEPMD